MLFVTAAYAWSPFLARATSTAALITRSYRLQLPLLQPGMPAGASGRCVSSYDKLACDQRALRLSMPLDDLSSHTSSFKAMVHAKAQA
jgi:hypothetical protein